RGRAVRRPLRGALVALVSVAGCVLDFNGFRVPTPTRDAGVTPDVGFDAGFDAGVPSDVAPDVRVEDIAVDQAPSGDRGDPRCAPPANAVIRVAHMALGIPSVDLCMRRATGDAPFAPVQANDWPAGGVAYATVSQHVSLNGQVAAANDRWHFALVPHGTDCAAAATAGVPVATLTVTVDPQSQSTLLFTSEVRSDGRVFGLLGLLSDQACTTCPANTVDVRAVHASLGASADRINLSINYGLPSPGPMAFVNVLFANNISYGQTAPVGGAGYDCDTAWRAAAALSDAYTVQFAAEAVSTDVLARSERVGLKVDLLLRSRMATVFFIGGDGVRTPAPEFLLCYEGARDAGMTVCDRIAAAAVPRPVVGDAGAPADAVDAPAEADAGPEDDVLL
ncbi:MAG: hypothetical protein JWM10_5123, partial [Myxococcaceae bacterium]|nr:hypothetical protein [Myxococcaceae bacterium]